MDDPQAEWENRSVTSHEVNRRWTEGSYIVKHKNLYYMLYSANFFGGKNYAVGYATSQNPLGPFTKAANNPVLQKDTEQGGIIVCSLIFTTDSIAFIMDALKPLVTNEWYSLTWQKSNRTGNWWSTDRIPVHSKLSIECSQANTGALRDTVKKLSHRFPIIELN